MKNDKMRNDITINPSLLKGVFIAVDFTAIVSFNTIINYIFNIHPMNDYYQTYIIFMLLSFIYIYHLNIDFDFNRCEMTLFDLESIIISFLAANFFYFSVIFSLNANNYYHLEWVLSIAAISVFSVIISRLILYKIIKRIEKNGVVRAKLVLLGGGVEAKQFLRRFDRKSPLFVELLGVFDIDGGDSQEIEGRPVLGSANDLLNFVRTQTVDGVVIALPSHEDDSTRDIIEKIKELPVSVYISADFIGFDLNYKPPAGPASALPMFEVVSRPIAGWGSAVKAIEDYILASIALLILSPVFAIIAIAVKLDSPGPVFFMQKRLGFNNQPFEIFKFRSMYHREVPEAVVRQARKGDPRVTRVGRILRTTSLDELPQLLNVLNGTMSLVGPRPHALSHNEEYGKLIRGYFARHRVKPGITGWAQVKGLRGETEDLELMKARIEADVYYAENWSLALDLRILVTTAFVVLFQKAAY